MLCLLINLPLMFDTQTTLIYNNKQQYNMRWGLIKMNLNSTDIKSVMKEKSTLTGYMLEWFFMLLFVIMTVLGVISCLEIGSEGIIIILGGLAGVAIVSLLLKSYRKKLNAMIKEEKEKTGTSKLEKKVTQTIRNYVAALVIVPMLFTCIYGFSNASHINERANELAQAPIDGDIFEEIEEFNELYEKQGLFTKLFFTGKKKIEKVNSEVDLLVEKNAERISKGISSLKTYTALESEEQYKEIRKEANALKLSDYDEYEALVMEKVENYGDLEKYIDDIEKLHKSYEVTETCSKCNGKVTGGSTYSRCSTCNGSGKRLVTWYSNGDWGEKSYSSYTCTSCNGSGKSKKSKPSCSGCGGDGIVTYYKFD